MPKAVGGIAAMVALAAGILYKVEPVTTVIRAGLAFLLGWAATHVWYVFFTVRVHRGHTDAGQSQTRSFDTDHSVKEEVARPEQA